MKKKIVPEKKDSPLSIRVKRSSKDWLEVLAAKDRRSISFLVQEAVDEYLLKRGVKIT